jgi:signal peptidase I
MLLAGIFAAVVGLAAGRTFLGSVAMVDGTSMEPTYRCGTWVFTSPISTSLERGDVVVIDDGHKDCAVKRIVGLPGETVHLWHGFVFVNRQILREPYVLKRTYTYRTQLGVFILGEGQYFVLGDNRINSIDSRAYGPVDRKQIKRRVPLPDNSVRARFDAYTLPTDGSSLPQHIASKVQGS